MCKAMPGTTIGKGTIAYQDLVYVTKANDSGIVVSVYTGSLRGTSQTVATEQEFLQKFQLLTKEQFNSMYTAQMQNLVQPHYYLQVSSNLLTIDGVKMQQGDVVLVAKMELDTRFTNTVSYKISFEVQSGQSKGKKFSINSLPHISEMDFTYLGDSINDGGISKAVAKAIEESDAAYQAANPSAATAAPAPNGEKKNNWVLPTLIAAALIAGGVYLYVSSDKE